MRVLFVLTGCLVVGCGSGSPFEYEKVSGKITYEDGSPISSSGLRLRFIAQEAPSVENAFPRPAFADVDAQGNFECVTSYKYCDGLIPGKHRVAIEMATTPDARPPVTKEYLSIDTTPLLVDTADAPFDIKVPKPQARPR